MFLLLIFTRDFAYPRPLAKAVLQVIMAFGFFYYAMGWPGQIYVVTVLIGLGYGSHWAMLLAAVSELFGLKSFGALYNFLTLSNPAGSLIFLEARASGLYDYYAEKQASFMLKNPISVTTKTLGEDKSLSLVWAPFAIPSLVVVAYVPNCKEAQILSFEFQIEALQAYACTPRAEHKSPNTSLNHVLKGFLDNRWLVFVCSMWIQSCGGAGYLFGSISPVIKSKMGYNQKQVAILAVAKDLGACLGFVAGSLSEIFPTWVLLLLGALQNFVGYGLLWLIVTQRLPNLPLWVVTMHMYIYVGTNGETFFNTAVLLSCVRNFPKNRGPVVGILKGFAGLSGAILTQVYYMIKVPDKAALIFMVAVGPTVVVIALMYIVRPIEGHKQVRESDGSSFLFTYCICLVLAAYLLGVLILEDFMSLNETLLTLLVIGLIVLILTPIIIPVVLVFFSKPKHSEVEESLLSESEKQEAGTSEQEINEAILSEVEDEKLPEVDMLPASERRKRMNELQDKLIQAAADGAVRVKSGRKGPHRGENFTLAQVLMKADFLLIVTSMILAAGSGLTIFNNLGQITQSLGYNDSSIYVAMISIWNFLGRVGGGYLSEIITRDFAYPRPLAMSIAQVIMSFGFFYYAMGWPGKIYVVSLLVGLCYGSHWAILPASVSELFGLKSFGALYNFITLANPAGSLIFSELIAGTIYDYYAKKQAGLRHYQHSISMLAEPLHQNQSLTCLGSICYSLTCGILSGVCIIASVLSLIVVYRTRRVYSQLYGKSLS
ncbi:hypothetical protein G4B88_018001 [Cannabis sativa]|uniref:Nodulin-like domain-containing protein n=2 Tax=Cannabis sativa TaxID=3483 RepID=A0A7J6HJI8_CANSA|nr:hypothetical protein G4B88_018001 [Cannabis sativa]